MLTLKRLSDVWTYLSKSLKKIAFYTLLLVISSQDVYLAHSIKYLDRKVFALLVREIVKQSALTYVPLVMLYYIKCVLSAGNCRVK